MFSSFQAHIGDIFRSKFSDYKNFHTMLYTCAAEFDFMEYEVRFYNCAANHMELIESITTSITKKKNTIPFECCKVEFCIQPVCHEITLFLNLGYSWSAKIYLVSDLICLIPKQFAVVQWEMDLTWGVKVKVWSSRFLCCLHLAEPHILRGNECLLVDNWTK